MLSLFSDFFLTYWFLFTIFYHFLCCLLHPLSLSLFSLPHRTIAQQTKNDFVAAINFFLHIHSIPRFLFFRTRVFGGFFIFLHFLGATYCVVLFYVCVWYVHCVSVRVFMFCAGLCWANLQVYRERLKVLHSKITARNERIKLLMQRGSPDVEPLDPA